MARTLDANGASKVFVIGRREEALKETASMGANGSIIPVRGDISSKESLQAAYDAVAAQTSHVDLFIANSGIMGPESRPPPPGPDGSKPSLDEIRNALWKVPMGDFSNVFDVNVTATYFSIVAFLPLLEAANKRRPAPDPHVLAAPTAQVIITSSIAGFIRTAPWSFAYNTSKAATTHLVKMLATAFATYDIRFNGLTPGLYHSDLAMPLYNGVPGKGTSDGSFPRDKIPASRGGGEEDIGGLVLFMASSSGGYLNGSIITTDGGRLSIVPSSY